MNFDTVIGSLVPSSLVPSRLPFFGQVGGYDFSLTIGSTGRQSE